MTIPGKVQAYLASGIPLLGMLDGEGARVIVESGAGFACAAGDGAGLARIVAQAADLPESQREAMGLSGRDYGRREFDRDALIDRLCGWLEEAAAVSPAENAR
jgi:glycosyltransferase involved in cell wall biosynthesis